MCLVAGLWTLLAPKGLGVAPLVRTATGWCCAFLAWQLTSYTLTAVRSAVELPGWLAAVGLLPHTTGPLLVLQLFAELATACILGGLARRQPTQDLPAHVARRSSSQVRNGTAWLRLPPCAECSAGVPFHQVSRPNKFFAPWPLFKKPSSTGLQACNMQYVVCLSACKQQVSAVCLLYPLLISHCI